MTDIDYLRKLDRELGHRRQMLVEINSQTRWTRPELIMDGGPPDSGYALASAATSTVLRDKYAYVTDVNDHHRWRQVDDVFDDLTMAAKALGL